MLMLYDTTLSCTVIAMQMKRNSFPVLQRLDSPVFSNGPSSSVAILLTGPMTGPEARGTDRTEQISSLRKTLGALATCSCGNAQDFLSTPQPQDSDRCYSNEVLYCTFLHAFIRRQILTLCVTFFVNYLVRFPSSKPTIRGHNRPTSTPWTSTRPHASQTQPLHSVPVLNQ